MKKKKKKKKNPVVVGFIVFTPTILAINAGTLDTPHSPKSML